MTETEILGHTLALVKIFLFVDVYGLGVYQNSEFEEAFLELYRKNGVHSLSFFCTFLLLMGFIRNQREDLLRQALFIMENPIHTKLGKRLKANGMRGGMAMMELLCWTDIGPIMEIPENIRIFLTMKTGRTMGEEEKRLIEKAVVLPRME